MAWINDVLSQQFTYILETGSDSPILLYLLYKWTMSQLTPGGIRTVGTLVKRLGPLGCRVQLSQIRLVLAPCADAQSIGRQGLESLPWALCCVMPVCCLWFIGIFFCCRRLPLVPTMARWMVHVKVTFIRALRVRDFPTEDSTVALLLLLSVSGLLLSLISVRYTLPDCCRISVTWKVQFQLL